MKLSRREWLGVAAGVAGTGLLGGIASARGNQDWDSVPARRRGAKRAKNIIFCVVDGMPLSCLSMVDQLRSLQDGKPSYWASLLDDPSVTTGLQDTRSLNSMVTDSSAASSTWGSGVHIWNGMVNMLADKTELRTLTQIMSEAGVRCGLVTTSTITHATPAGFAVSCIQRDLEGLIAEKYLTSGVEVLLGGGERFFSKDRRPDQRDLFADFAKEGFAIAKTRDELMAVKGKKVLGTFSTGHLPYSVDRNNDPDLASKTPTLAEMAKKAIEMLKGGKNGFLLQIEAARVDHGGHSNDFAAMIYDQIAFEEAVKVAIDFARQDGETLVIITADHACGGLALNGAGDEYSDATPGLKSVLGMKSSHSPILAMIGPSPTTQRVQDAFEAKLSLKLSVDEANAVVSSMKGQHPFGASEFYRSIDATIGMIVGNHSKCTFTSGNHHSDHVLVSAFGPGSEQCAGLTRNIEFFNLMLSMKGLKHKNPTMDFATAKPLYEKMMKELNPEMLELYASHEDCGCGHSALARSLWANHREP